MSGSITPAELMQALKQQGIEVSDTPTISAEGPTTWRPIDLEPVIEGGSVDSGPTMLRRADEEGLLYTGKIHALHGEPESGKSFLAQIAAVETMRAARTVMYLDFESGPDEVVGIREMRARVATDWAGRKTVSERDAQEIVRRYREAMERGAEIVSAYDAYLKRWDRERQEAFDSAWTEVAQREHEKQFDPSSWSWGSNGRGFAQGGVRVQGAGLWQHGRVAARNAGIEAVERYDRERRRLNFDEFEAKYRREHRWK